MLIDIHTHNYVPSGGLSIASQRFGEHTTQVKHTIGIYPFDVVQCTEESFVELEIAAGDSSVFGIGEIGLDYRQQYRDTAALQREVFERQVEIANRIGKPIVVHQVRAMDDTLRILTCAKVPVIMHGFSGSVQSAARFTGRGYYLSFGHLLLTNAMLQATLSSVPIDRVLMETDDCRNCTISEIYRQAAQIIGISIEQLEKQIEQNYVSLVGEN